MNLNKQTTAYKLYAACYIMARKLFDAKSSDLTYKGSLEIPNKFNFCPAMRTVFLWTPIYLALFLASVGGLTYVIFYLPSLFGGVMGYVNTYLIPGAAIALVASIIWGAVVWSGKHSENKETYAQKEARHEAGNYTLWETFVIWLGTVHTKTCPLVTVVDEPVKAIVLEPVPPTPTPVVTSTDVPVGTPVPAVQGKQSDEAEQTIDATPDVSIEVAILKETTVEEVTPSVVNVFLAKNLPQFSIFLGAAAAMFVVAFINLMMASMMQDDIVVFETAACSYNYEAESREAKIVCGEYEKTPSSTVDFLTETIIFKKVPHCSVTKTTYTDAITFDCEYK